MANSSLSNSNNKKIGKSLQSNKKAKEKAIPKKNIPTTAQKMNMAKTNLLKKKGRIDEAKALVKGGKGLVANAGKEMKAARNSVELNAAYDKRAEGASLQSKGRYVAVKAAQPYGEASRTYARTKNQRFK